MKLFQPLLVLTLLGGCSTTPPQRPSANFLCSETERLSVSFSRGRAIVRTSRGSTHALPRFEAFASGTRYSDGTHEFWVRGNSATWTVGRMAPMQCRAVR